MKEAFRPWDPSRSSKALLFSIDEILREYANLGYRLTLRQLYYQLVARDIIPNQVTMYTKLGNIVSRGRLAGIIDWAMIEDRTRKPVSNPHWNSPQEILKAAADSYYLDRWKDADQHVEVWCEKDAVSNILTPICRRWDLTFMANRGYSSQSAVYDGYQRLVKAGEDGKDLTILYLGDHDPSGLDMSRDIADRLHLMLPSWAPVEVDRIALNLDQIELYNPPENPAKVTDSRYQTYADVFGESSWELDALPPQVLERILGDAIHRYVNAAVFMRVEQQEQQDKGRIRELIKQF